MRRCGLVIRPRWRTVHFACHGLPNSRRPSASALALRPDDENDGFLTARELTTLRLPTDLVVLSACASGRDRTATGEGMLGLVRGAMIAGAPRVVASLWRVDDGATASCMERFQQSWARGRTTTEAMREARTACLEEKLGPRAWAGWVAWGLPD